MDVLDIRIDSINIPPRLRQLNTADVDRLAASIGEIGLKQPISVRLAQRAQTEDGRTIEREPLLVAGRHRLEALRKLGRSHVPCIEVHDDDLLAQLWEIDENLMRAELSPAQKAEHLARRKEIWGELNNGPNCPENGRGRPKEFASATVGATNLSKRDINRSVARAEAIGDDISRVAGTSLDKGVELDALAKLPPSERETVIAKAEAGEKVSARHLSEYAANESKAEEREWSRLRAAWNQARPAVRERMLDETSGCTEPLG